MQDEGMGDRGRDGGRKGGGGGRDGEKEIGRERGGELREGEGQKGGEGRGRRGRGGVEAGYDAHVAEGTAEPFAWGEGRGSVVVRGGGGGSVGDGIGEVVAGEAFAEFVDGLEGELGGVI